MRVDQARGTARRIGTRALSVLVALGMLSLAPGTSSLSAGLDARAQVAKDRRLTINWGQIDMWALLLTYAHRNKPPDVASVRNVLEGIIDEHAKAKIDRIVHCLFAFPNGTVPPGFRSFYRDSPARPILFANVESGTETGMRLLEESGQDFVQILRERARRHGIEFLAGMRMNDRHVDASKMPFGIEHPEWLIGNDTRMDLQSVQARTRRGPERMAMDYKHEGVRKAVLSVAAELLERHDVDGLELDWMRHCHVFDPAEAAANAPIINGFMREMRKLVDEAARKRGRGKLLLGVRIPQTVEECRALGYDVKTWVREGSVDYICPSDFFCTDFNMRVEDFVAMTKGTECKVYPSVHPKVTNSRVAQVHSAESYRAAARNHYAFGADGISIYNYHYHWRADMAPEANWPGALGFLTGLRDKQAVAMGDRHYLYHPLWPRNGCPTGPQFDKSNTLDLSSGSASFSFRIAEDLKGKGASATFEFKVGNIAEGDAIRIAINGREVPADRVRRGSTPARTARGDEFPGGYVYSFPLSSGMVRSGDNTLQLQIAAGSSKGLGKAVAQEFEIMVRSSRR